MTDNTQDRRNRWLDLARFCAGFVWPAGQTALRARVVAAMVFLVLAKLVNIAIPFFLKNVVDELGAADLAAIPLAALIGYGAARLGTMLFRELRDAVFAKVGQRAGRLLAGETYRHLFRLSLSYHLQRRTGELARSIDRGVKALSFLLRTAVFNLAPTLLEFVMVLGILLWRYPPVFAGITFVTIAGYGVFTVVMTNLRVQIRREMNERDNEFNAAAVDGLINYEAVKSFAAEGYEFRRLDKALAGYEDAAVRSETSLAVLNTGQAAIISIGVTLIMIFAAQGVVAGSLSVGDVVLLNAFVLQLYAPLNILGMVYREIRRSLTDLENIQRLLAIRSEIADRPDARPLALEAGRLEMRDVAFAYDPRRPIIENVSFVIESGRKLAVVGPSGGGKSTLVRLLFRFYDPTSGAILIDGQDLRDVTQDSLRRQIGLVPQDTVLFNDTIGANIAYGMPGAGREAIVAAARQAQIHDFIESLPDGYETLVGERGLKLSGGEKQRVAIARVLLKDPPILVLDEATSALDSETEAALQAALENATRGRTTLIIAHRLSTVFDADEILVLDGGRVAERGSHRELLAAGGLYAAMWHRQRAGDMHDAATNAPSAPAGSFIAPASDTFSKGGRDAPDGNEGRREP